MKMVSIIILNYNGQKYLKECIHSVLLQTYKDFEIIFFDNGSSDGSLDFVNKEFNDARLKSYSIEKNIGFAGGNIEAIKKCKGNYIVLLNNDTVVSNNWLEELVKTIELSDDIGMVQSYVHTQGIPDKFYLKNGTINLLGHNIMEVFDIDKNGIGEILLAGGCSLLIRRELIDKPGGLFPSEYFAYAEDTYLSFKVKFLGYKILHNSNSKVEHLGGATTKNFKSSFITFYQERNRILNFLIYFSFGFRLKYYPLLYFNLIIKIFYSLVSSKYSLLGIVKAYFWILMYHKWIKEQREIANRNKIIKEYEILKLLSGKIANGNNIIEKLLNIFSLAYLKLVNIKTIELIRK